MTATVTDGQTVTIEHLDWQPACEHDTRHPDSRPPATHRYMWRLPCHAGDELICADCARYLSEGLPASVTVLCCCGTEFPTETAMWSIDPL